MAEENQNQSDQQTSIEVPAPALLGESQSSNTTPVSEPQDTSAQLEKEFTPVNFSAFKTALEGGKPEIKQAAESDAGKPKAQQQPQQAAEVKPTIQQLQQQQPQQTNAQQTPPKVTRESVLTELGVAPEKHQFYKFMSNEAFEEVKGLLTTNKKLADDNKKLASALPPTNNQQPAAHYSSHPEAYVLSPEYKQASSALSIAQSVKDHWIAQAEKIAQGEPWRNLEVDSKGNIILAATDTEPSAAAESQVRQELRYAEDYIHQNTRKLDELRTGHNTKYQQTVSFFKDVEEKYFPGYDAADHWSHAVRKQIVDLLPEHERGNVLTNILAKTTANNMYMREQWAKEKKRADDAEAKLKQGGTNTQQLPKGAALGSGGASSSSNTPYSNVSMADFQKRLQGV